MRLRPGDRMWLGLGLYVLCCNVCACAQGTEMLSEACDRHLKGHHRWTTEVGLAVLYCQRCMGICRLRLVMHKAPIG